MSAMPSGKQPAAGMSGPAVGRRPPAIEPTRIRRFDGPEADRAAAGSPMAVVTQRSGDLPPVVLRMPELSALHSPPAEVLLPPAKSGKQHMKMLAVAAAVVLAAMLMFRGSKKPVAPESADDKASAPTWTGTTPPQHQPLPVWNEAVVALPKVETEEAGQPEARIPDFEWHRDAPAGNPSALTGGAPSEPIGPYPQSEFQNSYSPDTPALRTADASSSLTEEVRRAADGLRPAVRLDGTIEKNTPESTYDGSRSRPY